MEVLNWLTVTLRRLITRVEAQLEVKHWAQNFSLAEGILIILDDIDNFVADSGIDIIPDKKITKEVPIHQQLCFIRLSPNVDDV